MLICKTTGGLADTKQVSDGDFVLCNTVKEYEQFVDSHFNIAVLGDDFYANRVIPVLSMFMQKGLYNAEETT